MGLMRYVISGVLSISFFIGCNAQATEGIGDIDTQKLLARQEAAIQKAIEDRDKGIRRIWITPRTIDPQLLLYHKGVANRIEKVGTLNFPQDNGKRLYGSGIVHILISKDGALYEKEGGVHIEKSSENTIVDQAMIRAVRRAAPFGKCPPKLPLTGLDPSPGETVCVLVFPFNFTREAVTPVDGATSEKELAPSEPNVPAQN